MVDDGYGWFFEHDGSPLRFIGPTAAEEFQGFCISYVDVAEGFPCNISEPDEGVDGGRRQVLHAEAREETGDMEGKVRADGGEPDGKVLEGLGVVVDARDDEAGDFDMGDFAGADDGAFHGGKVSAPGAVEVRVPCLEVDVPCIDQGKKGSERLFVHAAVGDHGVHHAGLFDEGRGVTDEFVGKKGLIVRVGDADISFFPCGNSKVQDVLGRHAAEGRFCLGNFPVLAEGAAHVAAHAPDGEDARARMEVGEGLLLDGIERGGRAHAVCDGAEQPVVVQARAAPAPVVQGDLALVRAKMTDDAAIGISFIKYSFHDASERPEDQ